MSYELPSIQNHIFYGNAVPLRDRIDIEMERQVTKPDMDHQQRDFKVTVTMIDKEGLKTWRVMGTKT